MQITVWHWWLRTFFSFKLITNLSQKKVRQFCQTMISDGLETKASNTDSVLFVFSVDCNKTIHTVMYDLCFLLPILISLLFLPIVYLMAAFYGIVSYLLYHRCQRGTQRNCWFAATQFVSGSGIMAEMERRSINLLKVKFFLFTLSFHIWYLYKSTIDLSWRQLNLFSSQLVSNCRWFVLVAARENK